MIAFFRACGIAPTENNRLKSLARGGDKLHLSRLNNKGGISSGPHDRFGLSLMMADNISVSEKETVSKQTLCTVRIWGGGDTVVTD